MTINVRFTISNRHYDLCLIVEQKIRSPDEHIFFMPSVHSVNRWLTFVLLLYVALIWWLYDVTTRTFCYCINALTDCSYNDTNAKDLILCHILPCLVLVRLLHLLLCFATNPKHNCKVKAWVGGINLSCSHRENITFLAKPMAYNITGN